MTHGTLNTYTYHGCRCSFCKEAKSNRNRHNYQKNRERILKFNDCNSKAFRERIRVLKASLGCKVCGDTDASNGNLHFHHRDPSSKYMNVTLMWSHSAERVQEEIDKCDVLCVAHHKEAHRLLKLQETT